MMYDIGVISFDLKGFPRLMRAGELVSIEAEDSKQVRVRVLNDPQREMLVAWEKFAPYYRSLSYKALSGWLLLNGTNRWLVEVQTYLHSEGDARAQLAFIHNRSVWQCRHAGIPLFARSALYYRGDLIAFCDSENYGTPLA